MRSLRIADRCPTSKRDSIESRILTTREQTGIRATAVLYRSDTVNTVSAAENYAALVLRALRPSRSVRRAAADGSIRTSLGLRRPRPPSSPSARALPVRQPWRSVLPTPAPQPLSSRKSLPRQASRMTALTNTVTWAGGGGEANVRKIFDFPIALVWKNTSRVEFSGRPSFSIGGRLWNVGVLIVRPAVEYNIYVYYINVIQKYNSIFLSRRVDANANPYHCLLYVCAQGKLGTLCDS